MDDNFGDLVDSAELRFVSIEDQEQDQQQQQHQQPQQQNQQTQQQKHQQQQQDQQNQQKLQQKQQKQQHLLPPEPSAPPNASPSSSLFEEMGMEMLVVAVSKCVRDEIDFLHQSIKEDHDAILTKLSYIFEVVNKPRSPRRRQRNSATSEEALTDERIPSSCMMQGLNSKRSDSDDIGPPSSMGPGRSNHDEQSLHDVDTELSTSAAAGSQAGSMLHVPELASPYQDIPISLPSGIPPTLDEAFVFTSCRDQSQCSTNNHNSNTSSNNNSRSNFLSPNDNKIMERPSITSHTQAPRLSLNLDILDNLVTDQLFDEHGLREPEVGHQRSQRRGSLQESDSGRPGHWQVIGRPSWKRSTSQCQEQSAPESSAHCLRRAYSEDFVSGQSRTARLSTSASSRSQSSSKSYKLNPLDEPHQEAFAVAPFGVVPSSPDGFSVLQQDGPQGQQQMQMQMQLQDLPHKEQLLQNQDREERKEAPLQERHSHQESHHSSQLHSQPMPSLPMMDRASSQKKTGKSSNTGLFYRSGTATSIHSEGRQTSKIALRRQKTTATLCSGMDALRTEHETQLVATQAFAHDVMHHFSNSEDTISKLPVLLLRLFGVIPIFPGITGWLQCIFVLALFLGGAVYTMQQGLTVNQGAVYNHVSSALISTGVVCGIGALRLGRIQDLLGPNRNPLELYARQCGFLSSWNYLFCKRLLAIAAIWIILVAGKVSAVVWSGSTPVLALFFSSNRLVLLFDILADTMLFLLIFCHLHVCAGLETCVDQYCLRLFDSADLSKGIREWNILQALLRRAASTIEVCFVCVGTAMLALLLLTGIELFNLREQSYGEQVLASWHCLGLWAVNVLCPTALTFVAVFSSAQITEKCNRVPSLINSWSLSETVMDHAKQYAVQFINQSAAGFYVKGVRLNAVWAMKISYLVGVLMVTTITQSVLSPNTTAN